MKPHTRIYIDIPFLSTIAETELNFDEEVTDLISRVLLNYGIKQYSKFSLFGRNHNFIMLPNEMSCSDLFSSPYDYFTIRESEVTRIHVYYENRVSKIDFDMKRPLSELMAIAIYCFSLDLSSNHYYITFDPKTNQICNNNMPPPVGHIVIKNVNIFLPRILFTANFFPQEASSMILETLPSFFLTQSMRNALVLIQSRKKNGLELVKLTKEKINEMFSAFENGKSLSCFHHSELFSFVLMLISSSEIPLIPPSLHDLIIKSMQAPSDIEKLELASVIICYLPVTTYFLLLEFVQIFGGIQTDPSLNRTFIPLFAIALFQNTSSNLNLEIEFLLFLFLFYTKAFGVPSRIAQELRIKDGVLYLMEESRFGKVLFSTKGSSNISLKDTKRYKFEPNIISLMDKYRLLNDDEILSDDIMKEFKTFSSKLEQVSDLFSEYKNLETRKNMVSKKRREAFLPLEVENYALSELKFSILPEHPNPSDCKSNDEFSSISEGNSSNKQIPSKQKSKISDSQQQDKTEEDINGTEVIQRKTETNEEEEIQNNNENIEAMNSQENEIEIIINNEEEEIELIDSDSEQSDSDSNKEEESKSENETNNVTMEQSNEKEKEIKNDNKKHPKKIVKTKRVNKTSKKIIKVKRKVNTNKRKKTIKNISKEETNKNKVNEEIITNREEVIYNEKIKTNNEEEQSKEKTSCNEEETILKPDENKEQIVTSETNGNDDEEPIHKSDENKEQIVKHDNTNEEEESVKSDEIVNNNEQNTINNDGEDEPNKSSSSETVGKDKEEQSNSSASKSDSNDNEEDPNKSLANETHEDDGEIHSNNENITKSDSDNKEDPSKSVETNNNNNEEDNKEEESDGFQLRERRNESPKKRFSMDAFNSLLESDDVINQLLGESKLSTNDFNDGDEQYTNELTIIDESKSSDKEAD